MDLSELVERVGRLERALGEERGVRRSDVAALWSANESRATKSDVAALWSAIEDLQRQNRSREVLEQAGSTAASVTLLDVGVGTESCLRDVAVQTDAELSSVQTDARSVQTDAELSSVQTDARSVQTDAELSSVQTDARSVQTDAELSSVQTDARSVQTDWERSPVQTESRSCDMNHLEQHQLRNVLQYLDCKQLLRARRGEKKLPLKRNDCPQMYPVPLRG